LGGVSARGGGPAQGRPGRHAVSKPGGGYPAGGPPASGGPGSGTASGGAGEPAPPAAGAGTAPDAGLSARLAERTADLQRLQAEYANYRKRVERDRLAVREQALANVLTELLPVLDDIGRAREHGELSGGFKSVAESLESAAVKLGLASYGEDGEPFDPKLHEALMHSYSPDVTEPTCVRILQPGYKVGDRILRPARVAVAEPGEPEPEEPDGAAGTGSQVNEGGGDDAHSSEHASSEAASSHGINTPGGGTPRAGSVD
jgi:molecular chaperone GrpE